MIQKRRFYWLLISVVVFALAMLGLLSQYGSFIFDKEPITQQEKSLDSEIIKPSLTLDFVSSEKIGLSTHGIAEPSGLALSALNDELWVVSDDASIVFKLNANNLRSVAISMTIEESELEAITLAESEGSFFTVNEKKGRIARFSIANGQRLKREKVRKMVGYEGIRSRVEASGKNSGFEGITWHSGRQSLFAVLEGPPGILVEISSDLKTIKSSIPLTAALGFVDPDNATIDFSGVSYDATRDKLWIVSDQAARAFVFDLKRRKVIQSLPLRWISAKGKQKSIKKAEGIALSADGTRLYVVSDSKASLYQWRIR